jgi:hypothetical protein
VNNNSTIENATINLGNNTNVYTVTGNFVLNSGFFTVASQGIYRTKVSVGSYSQTGGTYTSGSFTYTEISGDYALTGGTFVHSSSSYLYISGNYSYSNATYTQNSGSRIYFDEDIDSAINSAVSFSTTSIYISKGLSYTLTLNCDLTVGNFYIISGNINTNSYTITAGLSSSNFNANGQTINKLVISGSPVYMTGSITIDTTLVVNTSKIMSINGASVVVTLTDTVSVTLGGSMTATSGAPGYYLLKDNAVTNFPTTGALQGVIKMQADTKNITIPSRTYAGRVELINSGSTDRVATAGSGASQTITIGGSQYDTSYGGGLFLAANGLGDLTLEASTYNPNIIVTTYSTSTATGDIDFTGTGGGSEVINAGSGNWTVKGDINFTSGVFNKNTSTFVLNGTESLQTQNITSVSQSFYNLTIQNNSTNGTIFADSATVTGTFTAITASSKITFDALSTYAFANININGQDSGTHIILQSSDPTNEDIPSRQWYFNVSQSSPQASYVTVTDSDATGGNTIIPVSCTDGSNNENWAFNEPPSNTSLTFTNPYSSNIAIADNTTEWIFEVKVTDTDGPTDIDYVELRLANSLDSIQPYDSLKFRWTELTDAFSELADTQNAAAITSISSDSSSSGNQWTLNFKIKFNDNFLAKSTDYAAEVYSTDDSSDSDNDNYDIKYQVAALSVSIGLDDDTIEFGSLLPGSVVTGSNILTVTSNYPNGYSLSAHDSVSSANSCLLHSDNSTRIVDYSSTIASPSLWSGTGLGICLYSATGKDTDKWGSGTTETDSNNKYAGVPETATIIHNKTGSPTSGDQNNIGYKLVVPNTQKTGDYSGAITYTATGVLE